MCCVGRVVSKLYTRQEVLSLNPVDRRVRCDQLIFWTSRSFVPIAGPETKDSGPFSFGFVVPVEEPGLKGFKNRD
jgi:hypothetical protein